MNKNLRRFRQQGNKRRLGIFFIQFMTDAFIRKTLKKIAFELYPCLFGVGYHSQEVGEGQSSLTFSFSNST